MPIVVKDCSWSETDDRITVSVPLRGAHQGNVHVYASDVYVSVNFAPYFFELDLFREIDHDASEATIAAGLATLELVKAESTRGRWGRVEADKSALTAKEIQDRRAASRQRQLDGAEARAAARRNERAKREQFLVQEQIAAERRARAELETAKHAHAAAAQADVASWAAASSSSASKPAATANDPADAQDDDGEDDPEIRELETRLRQQLVEQNRREMAPPRIRAGDAPTQITVEFTKRAIPTAARASKDAEYEAWLRKKTLAEAQSLKAGALPAQNSQGDDAEALEQRGVRLLESGNGASAAEAFSAALDQLAGGTPGSAGVTDALSLIARRGAANLRAGAFAEAERDCTNALELFAERRAAAASAGLADEFERDIAQRALEARCRVRRATAVVAQLQAGWQRSSDSADSPVNDEQQRLVRALDDLAAARLLAPGDHELSKDVDAIEARFKSGRSVVGGSAVVERVLV